VRTDYFADLLENQGNQGNQGNQSKKYINNNTLDVGTPVTQAKSSWVTRVTDEAAQAPPGSSVTQVTQAKNSWVTEYAAQKSNHNKTLSEQLPKLPKLPRKIDNSAIEDSGIGAKPSAPCPTCGSNHFWLSATGWQCRGCTEPEPRATTLCLPASQPTPDSGGNIPYRLNIGNVTRLVWLPPRLEPGEVLTRAKVIYPDLEVSDRPPPQGWPRLADIPEIPASGTPQPVEAWTPSGQRLVVTAYSDEHAAAIRRMNPPPATAPPANCRTCQRYAVLAVRCGFYGRTVAKPTDPICNGHQFKPREEVQS